LAPTSLRARAMRRLAWLLAAACLAAAAAATEQHNALERWGAAAPPRRELRADATLTLLNYTAPLPRSGAWLTVAWSGLDAATSGDFIAWHVPSNATLSNFSAPVKFQAIGAAPSGSLRCVPPAPLARRARVASAWGVRGVDVACGMCARDGAGSGC
jgi:hypothetical protein